MRRIVEIAQDHRHLHADRGFLVIDDKSEPPNEIGRVPFTDIEAVITTGNGISYSNTALVRLAQHGAPLVLSDNMHQVQGILMSIEANSLQAHRLELQIAASKPTNKRAWAQIVRAKVLQQAEVLAAIGQSPTELRTMARKVTSGDTTNIEAQAARKYWRAMFGTGFRRDRYGAGPNGFLNYGYTVLRASTVRAILAAGLHPGIGLAHSNDANSFRLADDLVEPFRPFVDLEVWALHNSGTRELDKLSNTRLVEVLAQDLTTSNGISPLGKCIQQLAGSLVNVYAGTQAALAIPTAQRLIPSDTSDTSHGDDFA